ncbi:sensor histidine kinase NtrY-like [Coralliovum pocilloporae]|uniref:sensor histidine kinase NtrY-like n=1 Tax=Coralliovum pocilloporae TaxID=3066369 RepID=UPI003307B63C
MIELAGHRINLPRFIPRQNYARGARVIGFATILLLLFSVIVSFVILMGLTPIEPTEQVNFAAIVVNGILLAILSSTILLEILGLWRARKHRAAGAQLHIRIVSLFSIAAALPAIIVAVLATLTLSGGLDQWFSKRTKSIIATSRTVASAYVQEHAKTLRADLIAISRDLDRAYSLYLRQPDRYQRLLNVQASVRGLPTIRIVRRDGSVVAESFSQSSNNIPSPPDSALADAEGGSAILIAPGQANLVGGIMKLTSFDNGYVYVARALDPKVVRYLRLTEENALEYHRLEANRYGVQIAFAILYSGIALIVLMMAIWLGIGFANGLVSPVRRLISASDKVSRGDLTARVDDDGTAGDLSHLSQTFNNMTEQLRGQREEILEASSQIDQRRRFTEAVLSGLSAGVIGLDPEARITLVNRIAEDLLSVSEQEILGQSIDSIVPELSELVASALTDRYRMVQGQFVLSSGGTERTVAVRITSELSDQSEHGYVLTIDDISDLVTAQRSSAWADVARRIAHEIKNPLTPIQLSAERLKRRYGRKLTEDREIFDQCTDTIIRQVGDIGRMVDEFSSFARMPKPTITRQDLSDVVRQSVFLMDVGTPDIKIAAHMPDETVLADFDPRLMSQTLTNLLKNASEAVLAVPSDERGQGRIDVTLDTGDADTIRIDIIDNGIGLPQENRHRLLEPYMTTREKGTGLGLAIVAKILDEHGGSIELLDAPAVADGGRGALVRLTLPKQMTVPDDGNGEGVETSSDGD